LENSVTYGSMTGQYGYNCMSQGQFTNGLKDSQERERMVLIKVVQGDRRL